MTHRNRLAGAAVALAGAVAAWGSPSTAAAHEVPTYEAVYEVEYKGRRVGESTQSLSYDDLADVYRFESTTSAKGLARLIRSRPVIERSAFTVDEDGALRPLTFATEDGTRRGDDSYSIDFDWARHIARIDAADADRELPLTPGVLDRGALQVALMLEVRDGVELAPHQLIDESEIETYAYTRDGQETIETPAGRHETVRIVQQRADSSRVTVIWLAPELEFLPVKIEQRRDGEALTTLTLESVSGL